jgi:hypothetical protein
LAASFVASFVTPPEHDEIIVKFYKQVRPWGFWGPVCKKVLEEDPEFIKNRNFRRDMFNVIVGIIWQFSLIALPVYLVVQKFSYIPVILGVLVLGSWILKRNWYDKLEEE